MPARTLLKVFRWCLLMTAGAVHCTAAQGRQIRVAAASDLQGVMPEVAAEYERETGAPLDLVFGSSGNIFAQIQNGAPFDVFFSADSEFPAQLIQSGRAEPRSAVIYAVGRLILWVPASAKCDPPIEKWNCLLMPQISRIAIANPAHAPYGRAAVQALQSAHVYEEVRTKLVFGENIAQAAQFAQSGNAQAAILAYSQLHFAAMRGGKHWEIPKDFYPPLEQTAVILKATKDKAAAQDLMRFVAEGRGRKILDDAGFSLPGGSQPSTRHK